MCACVAVAAAVCAVCAVAGADTAAAQEVAEGSGAGPAAPVAGDANALQLWVSLKVGLLGAAAALGVFSMFTVRWFRLTQETGPRRAVTPAWCAAGFLGAMLMGTWAAQAALEIFAPESGLARDTVASCATGTVQSAWLLGVLAFNRRQQRAHAGEAGNIHSQVPVRAPASARQSWLLLAASTILVWPAVWILGAIASQLERLWQGPAPQLGHETLQHLAEAPTRDGWWWGTVLSAVIVAPAVEELLHRGVVQQGLKGAGFSRAAAICATAALFSLLHWNVLPEGALAAGLVSLLCLGIYWGWLYERTGRLSVCIAAHALFNAENLLGLVAGR